MAVIISYWKKKGNELQRQVIGDPAWAGQVRRWAIGKSVDKGMGE
jgi:hypothetical protein